MTAEAVCLVPDVKQAVKIGCRKCYGVLWVGTLPNGKHYCQHCKLFTQARQP